MRGSERKMGENSYRLILDYPPPIPIPESLELFLSPYSLVMRPQMGKMGKLLI